jgi:Tol biopolymer transport system component
MISRARSRTPVEWDRLQSLFHAALELPAAERVAFLECACASDTDLRREVEGLLAADARSACDFEHWAANAANARTRETADDDLTGRHLGRYELVRRLGLGGMGVVYLARDPVLGRHVAIKTLPSAVAHDAQWLERFRQEARAASSLSHPNVAAVHELADADTGPFIVMEYVDGMTLDALVREGPLPPAQVLDIGRQVLSALEDAHPAGIVHRDIKAGNVMITARGVVKVLDFGLAKLAAAPVLGNGLDTTPGLVVGTIDYMSPEQARAERVDHRSDLFSTGVLLYQLATGRVPFRRGNVTATLDALLHEPSASVCHERHDLPRAFDDVLARALAKSPAERYQSAREFADDLDALARNERLRSARRHPQPLTRRHLLLAAAVVAAGVTAIVLVSQGRRPAPMVVPLTSLPGLETAPALSPDGEFVAFAWEGPVGDNVDVYVQRIGGQPVRLTQDPAPESFPTFSPDGRRIAFVRAGTHVWVMNADGTNARAVSRVAHPRVAFAADGRGLVMAGPGALGVGGAGLVELSLEGGSTRRLTDPPTGSSDIAPAVSPEGRLAFQRVPTNSVADIWVASAGSPARRLTFDERLVDGPTWTPDGRALIFASGRKGAGRLWRIDAAGGDPVALPDTGPGATQPAMARAAPRLAFVASLEDTNLWEVRIDPRATEVPGTAQPAAVNSSWLDGGPDVDLDGRRMVFTSNRSGRDEIFIGALDGGAARQLTDFSAVPASTVGSPRLSPDGRLVAFDARVGGNADIYLVSAAGGEVRRLTQDPGVDVVPVWSPDGRWIYFTSRRTGRPEIWRMPIAGGSEAQVTTAGGFGAQFTADGGHLLYLKDRVNSPLWRRAVSGGAEAPAMVGADGTRPTIAQFASWRPTASGVVFLDARRPAAPRDEPWVIRQYDDRTRVLRRIVTLTARPTLASGGIALSPDGTRLWFTQTDQHRSDINLLQPYR